MKYPCVVVASYACESGSGTCMCLYLQCGMKESMYYDKLNKFICEKLCIYLCMRTECARDAEEA